MSLFFLTKFLNVNLQDIIVTRGQLGYQIAKKDLDEARASLEKRLEQEDPESFE